LKIGFIGAGKAGKALGLYFKNHGLTISGYYSKTEMSAQEAARMTGSKKFAAIKDLANASSVVIISVPDHALLEIDSVISTLMNDHAIDTAITCIHVSGAHSSDSLVGIKAAGSEVCSIHPLLSFGEPIPSALCLDSTWFTLEGTEKAVQVAKTIMEKTGGHYSLIKAEHKPLYHAGACVVSNFLVTLLESGIEFFEKAGIERAHVIQAIDPLIASTLSNVRETGTIDALTGPIVRSDFNTVSLHLDAIKALLPRELDLYQSMARRTVQMLEGTKLTGEQAKRFQLVLGETIHVN